MKVLNIKIILVIASITKSFYFTQSQFIFGIYGNPMIYVSPKSEYIF